MKVTQISTECVNPPTEKSLIDKYGTVLEEENGNTYDETPESLQDKSKDILQEDGEALPSRDRDLLEQRHHPAAAIAIAIWFFCKNINSPRTTPSKTRISGTLENVAISMGLIVCGVQITFWSCNARTGGSTALACVVSIVVTIITVAINGAINGGPDKKTTAAQAIVVSLNRMAEDTPVALLSNVLTVRPHKPKITYLYIVACVMSLVMSVGMLYLNRALFYGLLRVLNAIQHLIITKPSIPVCCHFAWHFPSH